MVVKLTKAVFFHETFISNTNTTNQTHTEHTDADPAVDYLLRLVAANQTTDTFSLITCALHILLQLNLNYTLIYLLGGILGNAVGQQHTGVYSKTEANHVF